MTVLTKEQPDLFSASVDPLVAGSSQQYVGFSGVNYFGTSAALIESSGPVIRGHASNGQDWAVYTNTPGSRLDASLGAPSLQHSYVGVASGGLRQSRYGEGYWLSAGFFGGESTANMPMYGQADYAGTFEGLQEHSVNGAEASKSNISGRANLAVDFGARTVRGRIDNINNHSAGPVKVATDYSLGYSGAISNSSFAGTAWMTHRNSDTPFSGYSQNSGTLQGGFFGPGAAEAAGAIGVSAVGEPVKYLITGAFGAKKR